MPVVRNISLSLQPEQVLRQKRFRGNSNIRLEIDKRTIELLDQIEEAQLLKPVASYEILAITGISSEQVSLEDNAVVCGTKLPSLVSGARELAVVVCTVGPWLEKQVTDYSKQGEPLRGLLLDSIGNTAVQLLGQEVRKLIHDEVSFNGYQVSSPIKPGMPGLPITEQRQLLELASAREIGVSLTPSGMMVPRKSISMFLGIGPQMKALTQAQICARCELSKTCTHRTHTEPACV